MKHWPLATALAVAVLAIGVDSQTAPGLAADTMRSGSIDCTKAASMMKDMMRETGADSGTPSMAMTGDVDHDYMVLVARRDHDVMMAARVEMKCGKNAKAKSMAKTDERNARRELNTLSPLLGGG